MGQATTVLFSKFVVGILVAAALIALIVGRLRRHLRVSPDQPTSAPITWIVSMGADARLHRRLRATADEIRHISVGSARHREAPSLSPAQRLARDAESEVIGLDDRLVATRSHDYDARRRVLGELRADTDRIDVIVRRLKRALREEGSNPAVAVSGTGIADLITRLDHLEAIQGAAKVIETGADDADLLALDQTDEITTATAVEVEQ